MSNQKSAEKRGFAEICNINWPQIGLFIANAVQAAHVEGGAEPQEPLNEFVVRHALREALVRALGGLEVNHAEHAYPDGRKRMDLQVGKAGLCIGVELKSDPKNIYGVKSDWEKIALSGIPYKLVVFAGIAKESEFLKLKAEFSRSSVKLQNNIVVHRLNRQVTHFGGNGIPERVAFCWLWYVNDPLPKAYELTFLW